MRNDKSINGGKGQPQGENKMKIIIRPRGGGKTTQIIKEVIKEDGYLLTFCENERRRLEEEHPTLKDRIFSWKSLPCSLQGRERKPLFIDNADYWLREHCEGYRLGGITFNLE